MYKWIALDQTRFILIVVALLFVGGCVAQATTADYQVGGRVLPAEVSGLSDLQVALLTIQMGQQPSKSEYLRTRTGDNGEYRFTVASTDIDRFFRIEVIIDGRTIGSEPFRFKNGEFEKTVDIQIPGQIEGIEHLIFKREILIIDLLDKGTRVTNIINIENNARDWVAVKTKRLIKRLPDNASNIQVFRSQIITDATPSKGSVSFQLSVPPGNQQLVLSYDLPVSGSSLTFANYLPPRTKTLEVLTMKNQLSFTFIDMSTRTEDVITLEKRLGQQVYTSRQINVSADMAPVSINVRGFPTSMAILLYPAYILAVLLIVGLVYFVLRLSRANPIEPTGQA